MNNNYSQVIELYNFILTLIKYIDISLKELHLYFFTFIFALCLFLFIIYVFIFDINSFYKKNLVNALILSVHNVIYENKITIEGGNPRFFATYILIVSTFWNWAAFFYYYYLTCYNPAIWFETGFPVLKVLYFYIFWFFLNIFFKNFMLLLAKEEPLSASFWLFEYFKKTSIYCDFLVDNLSIIAYKINNRLIDNINTHFATVWPFCFFVVFLVYFNVSNMYIIDYFMLMSIIIIFIVLLCLMTFSKNSSKEISVYIVDQLFYTSVGAFVLLFSCINYYDVLYIKLFFLNGALMFSSGAFFFKFWIIFFFMLCMWLSNFFVKQSSSSLVELPLLFLVAVILLLIINGLTDIFAIVLSFEILSLIIIGLCGLTMNKISTEASIKYFCQNSIVTGLVLVGVFFYLFLFKNTNLLVTKLFIEIILNFNLATYYLNVLLFTSIIFWLFGFFFKFGIFPVNFYVADIYNGSSAPVILFISSIIKPTILFLFYIRIVPIFSENIILLSIVCSFCLSSIILGDWMSLNSSDIKRFFGHSSVSQYGFIVLSLFSKSIDIAFYTFLYLFIYNISLFLIITILIEQYNYKLNDISRLYFNDLNSYFKNNISAKLLMTVNILLISGLPPFILFLYKYAIFVQIFGSKNYIFLLLIFIFNTGFSSAYYFRIISDMWATNLLNVNLINLAIKKNLAIENTIINDRLKIYFFWFLLIFFYFLLIKYFDLLYNFGILIILDNLI